MKKVVFVLLVLIIGALGYFYYTYAALGQKISLKKTFVTLSPKTTEEALTTVPYKIDLVAQDLFVPWSLVFTSPERMLVTERSGTVRVVLNNKLQPAPLLTISDIPQNGEEGLMGLTIHPLYNKNKYVYLAYAYSKGNGMVVKVARYKDQKTSLKEDKVVIDNLPASQYHAGTRIKFGPDGKLYITTGDATQKEKAQDLKALNGKMLRLNDDGSIPSDNPFPHSPIYTYGHRNSQGFDWHPVSHVLFETEHGPSQIDGPAGGDEINILTAGKNYGWPLAHHEIHQNGMKDPVVLYTPAVAPADMTFYSGKMFPQFKNNFFFAALKGEGIYRVILADDSGKIASYERLADITVGRIREIIEAPDGSLYFTTSNRDNRGTQRENDDKIYRIFAKQ